jgi:Zn-dependent protease with chaperone function
MSRGIHFDGLTADEHDVGVEAEGDALIVTRGGHREAVPAAELKVIDEDSETLTLSRTGKPGWRLVLQKPIDDSTQAILPRPNRYGSWIDRVGLGRATATLAGIAAVVVFIGYSAPAWLAPLVPASWEKNLGTALVGDFGDNACRDPAAKRALDKLAVRIEPNAPAPIAMTLIDVGIFNAAALPGGQIVIFDGALEETENPDAMAGVLAHEIAHVRRRHVTQALIRELGIGALIRLFAGGVGANAEQLVSLSYTRANEAEADADAIAALKRANIDPRPTAALFSRLDKEDGDFDKVEWLNSHPRSKQRARLFAASYQPGRAYQPSLPSVDYRVIRQTCTAKRNREKAAEKGK